MTEFISPFLVIGVFLYITLVIISNTILTKAAKGISVEEKKQWLKSNYRSSIVWIVFIAILAGSEMALARKFPDYIPLFIATLYGIILLVLICHSFVSYGGLACRGASDEYLEKYRLSAYLHLGGFSAFMIGVILSLSMKQP